MKMSFPTFGNNLFDSLTCENIGLNSLALAALVGTVSWH